MSRIDVRHNLDVLPKAVRRLNQRQMPFATKNALNKTAEDFQKRQRRHQNRVFDVHNRRFVNSSVKVKPFASKERLRARISIDPPGGQARADILSKFEKQTRKNPFRGSRIAIPVEVRRTSRGVTKKMKLKNLNFRQVRPGYYVGEQNTHMVLKPGGRGFVFQRYGRGKKQTRLVYTFKPSVPIKPELNFHENARAIVRLVFPRNMRQAFLHAVRTSK